VIWETPFLFLPRKKCKNFWQRGKIVLSIFPIDIGRGWKKIKLPEVKKMYQQQTQTQNYGYP
jgi:hypothetical protein